jgi:hypothetical protein
LRRAFYFGTKRPYLIKGITYNMRKSDYERRHLYACVMREFWDWFWYYRRGKIKYHVWGYDNSYTASANNGIVAVWNCEGSTPEAAKEMAAFRLKIALKEISEAESYDCNSK